MPEGVGSVEPQVARGFAVLLLAATAVRLLVVVVAGFVEWHNTTGPLFPTGRARAFDVLTTFGSGGDGAGVLLALAAAAAVWWATRLGAGLAPVVHDAVSWVFGATAVLAVLQGVGFGILYSIDHSHQASRLVQSEGYAVVYVAVTVGAIVLLRRLTLVAELDLAADDLDAIVFAVDRATGDVRAFFSGSEASRRMHVYSVEDDEFAFYTDEGVVLDASVVEGRVELRPTGEVRAAELLERLKDSANRRGLSIAVEDADDPTAYAAAISRWHWLDMWPAWMRPIGMLFRRTG